MSSSNLLSDAIKQVINNEINEIHTVIPGKIESYDHTKQKASVKPLIKRKYKDDTVQSLPVIVEVPVIWPRAGGASLTFPVKKDDYILILFSERDMERYLSKGEDVEPGEFRKYDLSDAIAIPGMLPFSVDSKSENNEDVLLIYQDTKIRIKQNSDIEIEGANNEKVDISGDVTVNIGGNANVTVDGSTTLNSSGVEVNSDIQVNGTVTVSEDVIASGISLVNHTHPGDSGGTTGPPN